MKKFTDELWGKRRDIIVRAQQPFNAEPPAWLRRLGRGSPCEGDHDTRGSAW